MGGLLTHLIVGAGLAIAVYLLHFRREFALAALTGHLLPDALKFGLSAMKQLTWKVFVVQQDGFFLTLASLTGNPVNWFALGFFVVALAALLYHHHVVSERTMEEYDELYGFLLLGVLTHLLLDVFVVESGPWI